MEVVNDGLTPLPASSTLRLTLCLSEPHLGSLSLVQPQKSLRLPQGNPH